MSETKLLVDIDAVLAESRADDAGRCPYCCKMNPEGARDPEPPFFAPHPACEAFELRAWAEFHAAEMRVSGLVRFRDGWAFGSWGPGALLTVAPVALERLEGAVLLGAQPAELEWDGWW